MTSIVKISDSKITKSNKKVQRGFHDRVCRIILQDLQRPAKLIDSSAENVWVRNRWVPFQGISSINSSQSILCRSSLQFMVQARKF
jgi:hypothetical protein